MKASKEPRGGVTLKKYAALFVALGIARAELHALLTGDEDADAQHAIDLTDTARIAEAIGCEEADISVDWRDHLSDDEVNRLRGIPR